MKEVIWIINFKFNDDGLVMCIVIFVDSLVIEIVKWLLE